MFNTKRIASLEAQAKVMFDTIKLSQYQLDIDSILISGLREDVLILKAKVEDLNIKLTAFLDKP